MSKFIGTMIEDRDKSKMMKCRTEDRWLYTSNELTMDVDRNVTGEAPWKNPFVVIRDLSSLAPLIKGSANR
jgi:hypothetical protein